MRDIYSKANKTIIWLGGKTTDELINDIDVDDPRAPLPPGFGNTTIDQYDLTAILKEFRRTYLDTPCNETQVAFFLMLRHCLVAIMEQEWWERIWILYVS